MTILDAERETGLERSAIRFYEREGLISPRREKNGYRDYSEEDVTVLKRVKLLRELEMPLEDIRALAAGRRELPQALAEHIRRLEERKARAESSQQVCRDMARERAQFATLDAQRYLDALHSGRPGMAPASVPESDAMPKVYSPWRRYFARGLDFALYHLLLVCLMTAARIRPDGSAVQSVALTVGGYVLMLAVEPLLLHLWGTTPGKWLLGLRVSAWEGGRLSWSAALSRSWQVLWRGYGLDIPFYGLWRLWKSYKAVLVGEEGEWEDGSVLELKDERGWRSAACAGALVLVSVLAAVVMLVGQMPPHRGELTLEKFTENYNDQVTYWDLSYARRLRSDGTWVEGYTSYPDMFGGALVHSAPMEYITEDGLLTGVRFSAGGEGADTVNLNGLRTQMMLCTAAFAGAQREVRAVSTQLSDMMQAAGLEKFNAFSFTVGDVTVECRVTAMGYVYWDSVGILQKQKGVKACSYSLEFSMTKS